MFQINKIVITQTEFISTLLKLTRLRQQHVSLDYHYALSSLVAMWSGP